MKLIVLASGSTGKITNGRERTPVVPGTKVNRLTIIKEVPALNKAIRDHVESDDKLLVQLFDIQDPVKSIAPHNQKRRRNVNAHN